MSLDAGTAYQDLVGATACEAPALKRVEAASSAMSYLINKLNGDLATIQSAGGCAGCPNFTPAGNCGSQMPLIGAPLPSSEIQVIRDWIDQGAKNN